MAITTSFRESVILSIVEYCKEYDLMPYEVIFQLIYDLTHIISGSGVPEEGDVKETLKKHQMKQSAVFGWGDNEEKHVRKHCARWLTKVDRRLKKTKDLDDLTWFDVIIYLMFIQSNCHHHRKISKKPESFLNFFYKSKVGFDPEKTQEQCKGEPKWSGSSGGPGESSPLSSRYSWDLILGSRKRYPTDKAELLSYYWVGAFERDKEELLMFHDLSIRPGEPRRTIGWTSRLTDFIPWGGVLNRLREYHDLPLLGCEYDLGIMSVRCSDYPPKPRGSSLYKKSEDIGNRDIRIVLGDIGLWAAATIGLWFVLKK